MESARIKKAVYDRLLSETASGLTELTDDTEIYYDLWLYGDDLEEFLIWVRDEFSVDFSGIDISQYAPDEGGSLFGPSREVLERRPYSSLTLGMILSSIDGKKWNY